MYSHELINPHVPAFQLICLGFSMTEVTTIPIDGVSKQNKTSTFTNRQDNYLLILCIQLKIIKECLTITSIHSKWDSGWRLTSKLCVGWGLCWCGLHKGDECSSSSGEAWYCSTGGREHLQEWWQESGPNKRVSILVWQECGTWKTVSVSECGYWSGVAHAEWLWGCVNNLFLKDASTIQHSYFSSQLMFWMLTQILWRTSITYMVWLLMFLFYTTLALSYTGDNIQENQGKNRTKQNNIIDDHDDDAG